MKDAFAKTLSLILGFPLIIFLVVYGVYLANLGFTKTITVLLLLIFFQMFIPTIFLIGLYKMKMISDIDIINRKERVLPFLLVTFCFSIAVILSRQFGNIFLFNFQLILFITMLVSFAITLFWKISLHMGLSTVTFIFLLAFSGVRFLPFIIMIPLIYWARLYLKRHTHAQLIAGFLVNAVMTLSLLKYFTYL